MKKKFLFAGLIASALFCTKNVYAFDSNNYKNRNICGNYEVAGFHEEIVHRQGHLKLEGILTFGEQSLNIIPERLPQTHACRLAVDNELGCIVGIHADGCGFCRFFG